DDRLGQRLVHRDHGVAEAADALLVAQRLVEGLAEGDGDVLDRVVGVDVGVALRPHGQVERAVLAQRVEHVVVEPDAGGDVGGAGAVDDDLRLLGDALHPADPTHTIASCFRTSAAACRNASFSAGVPIVTRRCFEMPTSRISTPRSRKARHARGASAKRPKSTKLASLGTTVYPVVASSVTTRSRSARRSATEPRVASACRSAARAAAWVSTDRW